MPIRTGILYEIDQALYDTVLFTPGAPSCQELFTIPIGQQCKSIDGPAIKTRAETNMQLACTLPSPRKHQVDEIRATLMDADRNLLPLFADDGLSGLWARIHLALVITNRVCWEAPASWVADPNCVLSQSKIFPWLRHPERLSLVRLLAGSRALRNPLLIECGMCFKVCATVYQTITEPFYLQVSLEGLHAVEVN